MLSKNKIVNIFLFLEDKGLIGDNGKNVFPKKLFYNFVFLEDSRRLVSDRKLNK
jgi:hypothetical protein